MLAMVYDEPAFLSHVWFSDESYIHLNGFISRQTTLSLGFEWPDIIVEKPFHSQRATIWCVVSANGILSPDFVEDDHENPVTVNQVRYREKIITPFLKDLRRFCHERNLPLCTQWFQQDGATCHKARDSIHASFGNRVISRGVDSHILLIHLILHHLTLTFGVC